MQDFIHSFDFFSPLLDFFLLRQSKGLIKSHNDGNECLRCRCHVEHFFKKVQNQMIYFLFIT